MMMSAAAAMGISSVVFLAVVLVLRQRASETTGLARLMVGPQPVVQFRTIKPINARKETEQQALDVARIMAEKRAWEIALDLARQEARRAADVQKWGTAGCS
jgi:hypothetical protein